MCYMYKCRAIAKFLFLFFVYFISLINEFHCDIREPVPRIKTLLRRCSSVVRTSLISFTLHCFSSHSCIKYLAMDNGRYTWMSNIRAVISEWLNISQRNRVIMNTSATELSVQRFGWAEWSDIVMHKNYSCGKYKVTVALTTTIYIYTYIRCIIWIAYNSVFGLHIYFFNFTLLNKRSY